jgi:D-alanyl-D-alanine carboxypeptidase (penicillin-binding protein 5/6)
MFLRGGQKPRVIDLLRGLIIQSGNDAARQFAITLAGSEAAFAEAMTRRARALGLTTANFRNATGLPARGHEVSVADLARLAQVIRRDFPERMPLFSEKSFEWSGVRQRNRNPALFLRLGKNVRPVGMKTGHTSIAGYCVVASARKTRRNGETVEVIAVLAGLDSERARERETEAALLWALDKTD